MGEEWQVYNAGVSNRNSIYRQQIIKWGISNSNHLETDLIKKAVRWMFGWILPNKSVQRRNAVQQKQMF